MGKSNQGAIGVMGTIFIQLATGSTMSIGRRMKKVLATSHESRWPPRLSLTNSNVSAAEADGCRAQNAIINNAASVTFPKAGLLGGQLWLELSLFRCVDSDYYYKCVYLIQESPAAISSVTEVRDRGGPSFLNAYFGLQMNRKYQFPPVISSGIFFGRLYNGKYL
ncbi:hypothetical protein C8Q74DRAFT_1027495 [Fomes fomentarius]|nr:hypothetical protein C8Q74DRAFT_1027495 [Fomes fomentarius]